MQEVERHRRVGWQRRVGLGQTDVIDAAPLEHEVAGREIDLLHDRVEHRSRLRSADGRRVERHRLVRDEQRSALVGEAEVVQVGLVAVLCSDPLELGVRLIRDDVLARSVTAVHGAFPPGEHRLRVALLHLQIDAGDPMQWFEPHETAVVVDDHQAAVCRAVVRRHEE